MRKIETLALKDLWIDANQGNTKKDRAFGYIGTDEEYPHEDGDECEYCGWFFTWPGSKAKIITEDERQAVIESLELDETMQHHEGIPHELAVKKLTDYLEKKFPGNLDKQSDD